MALQISEKKGTFYVSGKIKTETLNGFLAYFEHAFKKYDKVVMNIDEVTAIDVDGLKTLKVLDALAKANNKLFYIVGYGSRDIYQDFESTKSQVA